MKRILVVTIISLASFASTSFHLPPPKWIGWDFSKFISAEYEFTNRHTTESGGSKNLTVSTGRIVIRVKGPDVATYSFQDVVQEAQTILSNGDTIPGTVEPLQLTNGEFKASSAMNDPLDYNQLIMPRYNVEMSNGTEQRSEPAIPLRLNGKQQEIPVEYSFRCYESNEDRAFIRGKLAYHPAPIKTGEVLIIDCDMDHRFNTDNGILDKGEFVLHTTSYTLAANMKETIDTLYKKIETDAWKWGMRRVYHP